MIQGKTMNVALITMDPDECGQLDEVNCVFCGKPFPSVQKVQEHISQSHDSSEILTETSDHRKDSVPTKILQGGFESGTDIAKKRQRAPHPNGVKKPILEIKCRPILPYCKKEKVEEYLVPRVTGHGDARAVDVGLRDTVQARRRIVVMACTLQQRVLLPFQPPVRYGLLQRPGLRCFFCRVVFLNKQTFYRHLLIHRRNVCYRCTNCDSKFQRFRILRQHQSHHCHIEFVSVARGVSPVMPAIKSQAARIQARNPGQSKVVVKEELIVKVVKKDEEVSSRDIAFAERFLSNPSITLNKGSQCVCNLCQSCFYSNLSILRHLVLYHRIAPQDSLRTPLKSAPFDQDQVSKPSLHFIHDCEHCGGQFASRKGLQRHLVSVHNVQIRPGDPGSSQNGGLPSSSSSSAVMDLSCLRCNLLFPDISTLEIHGQVCPSMDSSPDTKLRRKRRIMIHRRFRSPEKEGEVSGRKSAPSRGGGGGGGTTASSLKKAKVPPNEDGFFECDVCHKNFSCRSSLSNHVKSHFNFVNKPFYCSSCKQGFMSSLTLQHHRDRLCPHMHSGGGADSEPGHQGGGGGGAGVSAATVSQQHHVQGPGSSLSSRATSCMHCSAMFPDRSLLEDHASKEHSNHTGEVVCIVCPRSFTTYMAFRVHMTKSHGGPNGTSLKSHHLNLAARTDFILDMEPLSSLQTQASTPGTPLYSSRHYCPNCDKDFSTSQAVGNHKRACMPHLYKKVNL